MNKGPVVAGREPTDPGPVPEQESGSGFTHLEAVPWIRSFDL